MYLEQHFPCGPGRENSCMSIRMHYLCHKGIGLDVIKKISQKSNLPNELRECVKKELFVYHEKIIPAWKTLRRKKNSLRCILWLIVSVLFLSISNTFLCVLAGCMIIGWVAGSPIAIPLFLVNESIERSVCLITSK